MRNLPLEGKFVVILISKIVFQSFATNLKKYERLFHGKTLLLR